MAGPTSDDPPASRVIEGPKESTAREELADDPAHADTDRSGPARDQPACDRDQTASERDEVAGDRDFARRDAKQVHDWIRGAPSRARPPSTPPVQMGTIDAATIFDACRERLQGLLGDDADITVVEHAIAGYPLDDEEKAALWLWAIAPFDPATLSRHMLLD